MAKDDYYVIVYKILAYLYSQLKKGQPIKPEMLKHDGMLFQLNDSAKIEGSITIQSM